MSRRCTARPAPDGLSFFTSPRLRGATKGRASRGPFLFSRLVLEIRLDRTFQLDGQRLALAVERLAGGDADPAFADAVFLDVGLLLAGEADTDVLLQNGLVVIR